MSGKIRLGKSFDSRTRKKANPETDQETENSVQIKNENPFVVYLLTKGFSNKTIIRYQTESDRFIRWLKKENTPIYTTTNRDVMAYIQSQKQNNNIQRTIQSKLNGIKHYFNYLKIIQKVVENPTAHIKIKGIKRKILYNILSRQELDSLYYHFKIPEETQKNKNLNWFIKSKLTAKRNKIILGLIVYQGLNSFELSNLRVKDIKLKEGKIFIAAGRRSNERDLNLEAHQILELMEYISNVRNELLALHNYENDRLFISIAGTEQFNNIIIQVIKQLNVQNKKVTSLKQLRTSVITHWLKLYNLRQVQHMCGHRFVSSTEAYLVNDIDDLSEEIDKFHPI